jgi:hypothetical protein
MRTSTDWFSFGQRGSREGKMHTPLSDKSRHSRQDIPALKPPLALVGRSLNAAYPYEEKQLESRPWRRPGDCPSLAMQLLGSMS